MAALKRVGHVVLGVRDLPGAVTFYTEVLGMEPAALFNTRAT